MGRVCHGPSCPVTNLNGLLVSHQIDNTSLDDDGNDLIKLINKSF